MADQENNNRFEQMTLQQKLGLGVGIAAIIALLSGAWMWGQTPDYRVLYSNLSDRDGGAIIESLQQLNIPYKFAEGGGALLVPSGLVHEARMKLASQGLPKGGNVGFELMENQRFGITQFAEQVNYQRALEGELARSIQAIGAVASARVHLAIPKPSVFVKEQLKPTASVVLNLQGGRMLDAGQVSAIVHMVSSSVPEMSSKDVTVVDQNGTLLSASHDGSGNEALDASQLKYVQQIEQNYIKRIESLLIPLLGKENVRAQVTAEIDFARVEQTAEIFKPNQNPAETAVRSQQSSESLNGSGINGGGGVPGALSNQPPVPATAPLTTPATTEPAATDAPNISSSQKDSTVNYEVDRTIRHTVMPVGSIKRLSVAVVVNGNRVTIDAKGKSSSKPFSDEEKEQINNLIRDAVGFDQNRGDALNVQMAAFENNKETVEETPIWQRADMIELAKELLKYGLIAIGMFLIIFKIIKPALAPLTHPTVVAAEDAAHGGHAAGGAHGEGDAAHGGAAGGAEQGGQYSPAVAPYEQSLQTARQIAQQEPKIVASVIKEWVNGNE
ncbi:MAG: flagellar basal-body MS-ring/collar protein FliF [Gallionella sp.]|nr:flagellar basal-body MS-ring/collar protein FliF [Gallionella sp.]